MSGQVTHVRTAPPPGYGAVLEVDLDAIAANYRILSAAAPGAEVAATVKADAYGLGADAIAPFLAAQGCRSFFAALPAEGIRLRALLADSRIYILNGYEPGDADLFATHRLRPVLSSLGQIEAWAAEAPAELPAILHIDTGMNRLGLDAAELDALVERPQILGGRPIACVMSHLACADRPDNTMNRAQLDRFQAALAQLRGPLEGAGAERLKASLANSPGIFLGPEYHFDMVRPGAALFGLAPHTDGPSSDPNPMRQVVHLYAKILQVRAVDRPMTVGYGASHKVRGKRRIATIGAGYADGYLRAIGHATPIGVVGDEADANRPARSVGQAYLGGWAAPLVGRVSMDLITLDVTDIPQDIAHPGAMVELIGDHVSVDEVARNAGTIGYEILTRLGSRPHRAYLSSGAAEQPK
ncbi:MAG: alanine racemase [Alphaproteobacteria bacterium]|nr:alanine racemase [Alphaproteobacteria bacterium]